MQPSVTAPSLDLPSTRSQLQLTARPLVCSSLVKSVDLDIWTPEQMEVCPRISSLRARTFPSRVGRAHLFTPLSPSTEHADLGKPTRQPVLGEASQTWSRSS